VSAVDSTGRTIWIADAHRGGRRFVVRADEKLTALWNLNRRFTRPNSAQHETAGRDFWRPLAA
jgi:hypothetical protein